MMFRLWQKKRQTATIWVKRFNALPLFALGFAEIINRGIIPAAATKTLCHGLKPNFWGRRGAQGDPGTFFKHRNGPDGRFWAMTRGVGDRRRYKEARPLGGEAGPKRFRAVRWREFSAGRCYPARRGGTAGIRNDRPCANLPQAVRLVPLNSLNITECCTPV